MSAFAEIMSQVIAEKAQEEEQHQSDRQNGYITGRLVVDGQQVSLQVESRPQNYELIGLFEQDSIQVKNRELFIPITHHEAVNTMSTDGWPLYAGKYARIKR